MFKNHIIQKFYIIHNDKNRNTSTYAISHLVFVEVYPYKCNNQMYTKFNFSLQRKNVASNLDLKTIPNFTRLKSLANAWKNFRYTPAKFCLNLIFFHAR